MRPPIASAAALILVATGARAADLPVRAPAPIYAVRPPVAAVPVAPPLRLECSPHTGQPITVIYNEPGRTPWSVEPDLDLVPLPHAGRFDTEGAYAHG